MLHGCDSADFHTIEVYIISTSVARQNLTRKELLMHLMANQPKELIKYMLMEYLSP